IVQASPDILKKQLANRGETRVLSPRIDVGFGNFGSEAFLQSCQSLAEQLGVPEWKTAFDKARFVQEQFVQDCWRIGEQALAFAAKYDVLPVVVLGRTYTIHNDILNSNVPTILREQGALPIPVDCYPVDQDTPLFRQIYWGYGQTNLRAAHDIRRKKEVYSVFCSNYACGPDSFSLHFYTYLMENKPYAIIETDGHSGDAGTKTRVEAFLYCANAHRQLPERDRQKLPQNDFGAIEADRITVSDAKRRQDLVLIPPMGPAAEVVAALFRADGLRAESLPTPDREDLRIGRRYTSGKECVPMAITLGNALNRILRSEENEQFALLMPTANGPCRFGVYNLLHKIVFEKLGLKDRVRIIAPPDSNYFEGLSADFHIRLWVGMVAADILDRALFDVRPVEKRPNAAENIYHHYRQQLLDLLSGLHSRGLANSLAELPRQMFGVIPLLEQAATEFAAVKIFEADIPTVSFVGEIYCRLDPFANDYSVKKLEERGLRVTMAPFGEWIEYTTHVRKAGLAEGGNLFGQEPLRTFLNDTLQKAIADRQYNIAGHHLRWQPRTTVLDSIEAADPYITKHLTGEAVLTLGGPLDEHRKNKIHGMVACGPHECMPNKVAEAQLSHVAEEKGLLSLVLPLNGDPVNPQILDEFAFSVKQKYASAKKSDHHKDIHSFEPRFDSRSIQKWSDEATTAAMLGLLRFFPTSNGPMNHAWNFFRDVGSAVTRPKSR
ncbi:MAG: acyl-CoA dehydratase activase-related protein, partial [Pseudomonadota bacterium]